MAKLKIRFYDRECARTRRRTLKNFDIPTDNSGWILVKTIDKFASEWVAKNCPGCKYTGHELIE